jgi:hypothetical protein
MKLMIALFMTFFTTFAIAGEYRCTYELEERNVQSETQHTWTVVRGKGMISTNAPEKDVLAEKSNFPDPDANILNNVVGQFQLIDDETTLSLQVTFIENYRGPLEDATYFVLGRVSASVSSKSEKISFGAGIRGGFVSVDCLKL